MLTPLKSEVLKVSDLNHEARRFRTIVWSFQRNLDLLFQGSGLAAQVDHAALAEAFSRWRQAFDDRKHLAHVNRHDFVIYAAGLMLKELIAADPLHAVKLPASELPVPRDLPDSRLKRWPAGYAYTSYCLSVAAAVIKELEDLDLLPNASVDDASFWDSFRENTLESPALAVAFFDLICGQKPNWEAPDVPWLRAAMKPELERIESKPNTLGITKNG